jgi:peptide/nickel transport system substrate-binding protein
MLRSTEATTIDGTRGCRNASRVGRPVSCAGHLRSRTVRGTMGAVLSGLDMVTTRTLAALARSLIRLAYGLGKTPLLAAGLLVGCGTDPTVQPLRIATYAPPSTLDPHHHTETAVSSVLCNVYDALVAMSPTMGIEPALALTWEQADATHLRFALRPGVRFHDGRAFTSADVVANWRRTLRDPRCRIRHYLNGITDITADGDLGVVVATAAPIPDLLARLAFLFIVPAGDTELAEITEPIGTGAYRWVGPADGGGIDLSAWRGWRGRPSVGRVVFSPIADDRERLERLLQGRADVCLRLPDDQVAEVRSTAGFRVELQPRLTVQMVAICPEAATGRTRAALADPRVRRALLLASDRTVLVRKVLRGNATVAAQYVHPAVFGYDPALEPLPYDPGQARLLLREAGFAGGFAVELGYSSGVQETAEVLAADLAHVGVTVTLRSLSFPELMQRERSQKVPLALHSWACATGDAADFFDPLVHTRDERRGLGLENYSGYSSRDVDGILDRASRESDRDRRRAFLQTAQRKVLADLPILPLTFRWWYIGTSDRIDIVVRHDTWLRVADYTWR